MNSWRTELWDGVPLANQRCLNGLHSLKLFTEFLQAKARLDKSYSNKLERLLAKHDLAQNEEPEMEYESAMLMATTMFREDHKGHSTSSRLLERQASKLSKMEKAFRTEHRRLSEEAVKLESKYRQEMDSLEEARLRFEKVTRESEEAQRYLKKLHQRQLEDDEYIFDLSDGPRISRTLLPPRSSGGGSTTMRMSERVEGSMVGVVVGGAAEEAEEAEERERIAPAPVPVPVPRPRAKPPMEAAPGGRKNAKSVLGQLKHVTSFFGSPSKPKNKKNEQKLSPRKGNRHKKRAERERSRTRTPTHSASNSVSRSSRAGEGRGSVGGEGGAKSMVTEEQIRAAESAVHSLNKKEGEADRKYQAQVKEMRTWRGEYDGSVGRILDGFQRLENLRLTHIRNEGLIPVIEAECTQYTKYIATTSRTAKAALTLDPQRELLAFIARNRTGNEPPPLPVYENSRARRQKKAGFSIYFTDWAPKSQTGTQIDRHLAVFERNLQLRGWENIECCVEGPKHTLCLTGQRHTLEKLSLDLQASGYKMCAVKDEDDTARKTLLLETQKQEAEVQAFKAMSQPLTRVLADGELAEEELEMIRQSVHSHEGRVAFARVLNNQRNTKMGVNVCLSPRAFARLIPLTLHFLDCAMPDLDLHPVQIVMIMAQSFYENSPGTRRSVSCAPGGSRRPSRQSCSMSSRTPRGSTSLVPSRRTSRDVGVPYTRDVFSQHAPQTSETATVHDPSKPTQQTLPGSHPSNQLADEHRPRRSTVETAPATEPTSQPANQPTSHPTTQPPTQPSRPNETTQHRPRGEPAAVRPPDSASTLSPPTATPPLSQGVVQAALTIHHPSTPTPRPPTPMPERAKKPSSSTPQPAPTAECQTPPTPAPLANKPGSQPAPTAEPETPPTPTPTRLLPPSDAGEASKKDEGRGEEGRRRKERAEEEEWAPRRFLQAEIKQHPIWQSLRFWEASFFQQLSTKLADSNSGGGGIERWHSEAEQQSALLAHHNDVFACLGTFAHNMREFDVEKTAVIEFITKLGILNEIPAEELEMVLQMASLQPDRQHTPPQQETSIQLEPESQQENSIQLEPECVEI